MQNHLPTIHIARVLLPVGSPPIENGAVAVVDGRIAAVGPRADVFAAYSGTVQDHGEVILAPGLINAHCHLDYTVMRGAILHTTSFAQWIQRLNAIKRSLTNDDFLHSIETGFDELARWGTTTVFNIESFPELLVRMRTPRLRTWWFYEMLDIRNRVHTDELIAGALTFFDTHPHWPGGFGLSPHAPYTTSPALYRLAKTAAEKYAMPFTTHLAETPEEFSMFASGEGPLYEFLRELGRSMHDTGHRTPLAHILENDLLPRGAILVHMNDLNENDFALLARATPALRPHIVHCPGTHAYFQRRSFPYERYRTMGIPISLGTDSLASNDALNLFAEMQLFRRSFPDTAPGDILKMTTLAPAHAIGQRGMLGELTPGALADLIAIPYAGPVPEAVEAFVENRSPVVFHHVSSPPKRRS